MKRLSQITAAASLLLVALLAALHVAGLRFNPSKSVALGFYWQTSAPLEKGAYVLVCPPESPIFQLAKERGYLHAGFCPNGTNGMLKWVAASAGDRVSISRDGVKVNGKTLSLSKPYATDQGGRPLPQLELSDYPLSANELLLMGNASAASFDSRYFGLIDRAQIQGVVRPLFTW